MEDGRQAYAAKNYVEAVRLFKKAHRQGHKYAAVWVAEMYREGNGVPKDYAKAVSWYVCSAPGSLDTSLSHAAGLIEIADVPRLTSLERALR